MLAKGRNLVSIDSKSELWNLCVYVSGQQSTLTYHAMMSCVSDLQVDLGSIMSLDSTKCSRPEHPFCAIILCIFDLQMASCSIA